MGGSFVCVCPEVQAPLDNDWATFQPELERELKEVQAVSGIGRILICQGAGLSIAESGPGAVPSAGIDCGVVAAFVGCVKT
jgi:hypothetical protein